MVTQHDLEPNEYGLILQNYQWEINLLQTNMEKLDLNPVFSLDFNNLLHIAMENRQFNFVTNKHMFNSIFIYMLANFIYIEILRFQEQIINIYTIMIQAIYNYFTENEIYNYIDKDIKNYCINKPFEYLVNATYVNDYSEYYSNLNGSYFRTLDILNMLIIPLFTTYNLENNNIIHQITYNMLIYASANNKDVETETININKILYDTFFITIAMFQCLDFPSEQKKYFASSILNLVNYLAQYLMLDNNDDRSILLNKCYIFIAMNKMYNFNYYVLNIFNIFLVQNVYIHVYNGQIETDDIYRFTDIMSNLLSAIANDIGFISPLAIKKNDNKTLVHNGVYLPPKINPEDNEITGLEIMVGSLSAVGNDTLYLNDYQKYLNQAIPFINIEKRDLDNNVKTLQDKKDGQMSRIMLKITSIQLLMDYKTYERGNEENNYINSNLITDTLIIGDYKYDKFYVYNNIEKYDSFIYNNYMLKKMFIFNSLALFYNKNIYIDKEDNIRYNIVNVNVPLFYDPYVLDVSKMYKSIVGYSNDKYVGHEKTQPYTRLVPTFIKKPSEISIRALSDNPLEVLPMPQNWWKLPVPEGFEDDEDKREAANAIRTGVLRRMDENDENIESF